MSEMSMKPVIILPCAEMSKEDIQKLNDNGLCVVEAAEPMKVKFLDPIASLSSRTQIENASIKLSRILLNNQWGDYTSSAMLDRRDITRIFVDLLVKGTPLDSNPTQQEYEMKMFDGFKRDELRRLAREEAKAERDAIKAAKDAAKAKTAEKK